jgi:hypothetical protein
MSRRRKTLEKLERICEAEEASLPILQSKGTARDLQFYKNIKPHPSQAEEHIVSFRS